MPSDAKALASEGNDTGKVIVAKSISQMPTLLPEGKADLFIDSPFPSLAVGRLSGRQFLLRRLKLVLKGDAAERSGLKIRAKLLEIARIVK